MARRPHNPRAPHRHSLDAANPTPAQSRPQQQPATTGTGFINPYNFVRFLRKVVRTDPINPDSPPLRTHEKFSGLSGRIVVELTTVTPLGIPDAEATTATRIPGDPNPEHVRLSKPFCRVDGRPYIPGFALKGMLRSVAEAVSNSCFSVFTKDPAVFRDNRKFAVNYRRLGRLKRKDGDTWVIQDVHPDRGSPPREPRNPVPIWNERKTLYETRRKDLFPDDPQREQPSPSNIDKPFQSRDGASFSWYDFLRGTFGDTERRDYDQAGNPLVVRPSPPERREGQPVIIRWPVADQRSFPQYNLEPGIHELYRRMIASRNFRRFHGEQVRLAPWQERYLDATEDEIVWYRRRHNTGNISEIGRNFRYKWAYDPRAALPQVLLPCPPEEPEQRWDRLCPCCALFGMVEQRGGNERETEEEPEEAQVNAFTGKVAIGPAHWQTSRRDFGWINDHKILGTPKFSCRSFYLEPSVDCKTDVSTDEFTHIDASGVLRTNAIRGRKFYWHHTKIWQDPHNLSYVERLTLPDGKPPPETYQNARVEVLMPGAKFAFAIDFENLSAWELGLLLWAIALPDVPQGQGAHHLGLGKPIGLGTVTLSVKRLDLTDRCRRYNGLFDTGVEVLTNLDLGDEHGLGKYTRAFREKMEEWHGKAFYDLDNVKDLLAILSRQQPATSSDDVRIIYPPGNRREPSLDVHPEELHYQWFGGKRWGEPLCTIEEITDESAPKLQTRLR